MFPSAVLVHVFALRLAGGIIRSGGVEVKGLTAAIIPAILPVGSILFGLTDLNISVADTSIPDNKITTGQTKARNSSAIAMTALTTPSGEGGSNGP